jgi:uncharacterized 2Fe-2S/4Fe-4S cluster protein (DUF4445 family)
MEISKGLNQKTGGESPSPGTERLPNYLWLHVFPKDIWVPAQRGDTILDALQRADVEVDGDCGGLGKCGKCKIKILSVVRPPTKIERELLDEEEIKEGIRLACRTKITRDLAISVGEVPAEPDYIKILTTSHVLRHEYIPVSQLDPLVKKRPVTLPPESCDNGFSSLDCIKQGLGAEYSDLKASLPCLQVLPDKLKETGTEGRVVLHDHCLMDWQGPGNDEQGYGLVFDLGTSTLVGKLINLHDGSEVAVASRINSQNRCGADVISRLYYMKQRPGGLETLNYFIMSDLNKIIRQLLKTARLKPEDIFIAVAAGNTTMQHLLLRLSPTGIAEAPFSPVVTDGMIVDAADVGLEVNPAALLYVFPAKSGYIGGDLISFILTSGFTEQEDEIVLGLDLGTNGEIFLGNGKRLLTCSAAAGPAFEGARISSGMIAKSGAIEGARHEGGELYCRTIGNISPKGICGSGLVDLAAVLLHCGVIDHEGLIRLSPEKEYKGMNSRVIPRAGGFDFLVASEQESFRNRPIYLTQKDVRELQLAKAAIAAGIQTLMDELGIVKEDIDRVYLAGALGNYVDRISTLRIGLLPQVNIERIKSLGNAASMGASMVLLSKKHWQMAKSVTNFIEHVELSFRSDFNKYFVEHMDFPAENIW